MKKKKKENKQTSNLKPDVLKKSFIGIKY